MAALDAERWLSARGLIQEFHQTETKTKPEETAKPTASPEQAFDPNAVKHRGSYALRKLFHESDRLLLVKYVSPTCVRAIPSSPFWIDWWMNLTARCN